MKRKHNIRDFIAGALVTATFTTLVLPAGAALISKNIQVKTGVDIYVNGVKMEPTDANGKPVETFVYNGTTYVPLRAVSQSLGNAVSWDGENQRVYIGEIPGAKQYLLTVCPPYETRGYTAPATIAMSGKIYANGFTLYQGSGGGFALFNLDGQYDTLSFDVGHRDGATLNSSKVYIYLDGDLAFSTELTSEMLPQHFEVPLYNALRMKIETDQWGSGYGIASVELD